MARSGKDAQIQEALRAAGLVGQLGLVVVLPVVGGVAAGVYLARTIGGGGGLIFGMLLLGLCAGVYGAYQVLKKSIPHDR